MRNISFSLTTPQIRARTKTVTRRLGWKNLKPGDLLCACVKCMGLKPGEKIERLCVIEVVSNHAARLSQMIETDCDAEGFPEMTADQFVEMFCKHMGCQPDRVVSRIEFKYRDDLCVHGFKVGTRCTKGCRAEIAGD